MASTTIFTKRSIKLAGIKKIEMKITQNNEKIKKRRKMEKSDRHRIKLKLTLNRKL